MNTVAALPIRERDELFQETASRKGLSVEIIEKDFWVCWTLRQLFELTGIGQQFIFKGGTSLSKVFGVIDRFSEDIDISVSRHYLGLDPETAKTSNARKRQIDALAAVCRHKIMDEVQHSLQKAFRSILGGADDYLAPSGDQSQTTLLFTYPRGRSSQNRYGGYVSPVVRIEFGARSDHWPYERFAITSYAAEEFPHFFTEPAYEVKVLAAERTFWEKATILHAEYHRPEGNINAERISRHYYDMHRLSKTAIADLAIDKLDLLDRVVEHKKIFFRSAWANYDDARSGHIHLVPPESKLALLRGDYAKMRDMFFGDVPAFDEIIQSLGILENRINAAVHGQK